MTGMKYTLNLYIDWTGLGVFYSLWPCFHFLSFAYGTMIPD